LAGNAARGLSVVVGGVLLDPKISGVAVDAVQIGARPVAVPRFRAIANADWKVPGVSGLSVDAGVTLVGERPVRSATLDTNGTQLTTKGTATVNLGARYTFKLSNNAVTARLQVLNAFDDFSWDVNSSETLGYSASRRVKLAVTVPF
jgi:iron complex outermembrane recepter protein